MTGPMIVEFGFGTSLRRGDYTEAAARAVRAALWRNSINLAEYMGVGKEDMCIEVRIGCAKPDAVDTDVLAKVFPYGRTSFVVEKGGLEVARPDGDGHATVMAQAALIVSVNTSTRPSVNTPCAPLGGSPYAPLRGDMKEQRLIIEMAQGVDLHGQDDTKAARRAVEQALQGVSLPIFGTLDLARDAMRVVVHIAVPRPEAVDKDAIAAMLPYGRIEVRCEAGGLDVPVAGEVHVMAVCALEVFLPVRD